jgi:hypothetical protein
MYTSFHESRLLQWADDTALESSTCQDKLKEAATAIMVRVPHRIPEGPETVDRVFGRAIYVGDRSHLQHMDSYAHHE